MKLSSKVLKNTTHLKILLRNKKEIQMQLIHITFTIGKHSYFVIIYKRKHYKHGAEGVD